jgi:hypothetical protein
MSERDFGGASGPVTAVGGYARTLGAIVERSHDRATVRKADVGCGDQVIVRTRNSVYSLWALGDGTYAVSGGWFDRQSASPALVGVNGCTYGGSVIRHDVLAAAGLFLEFSNNVSTTRILDVRVVRHAGAGPLDGPPC